MQLICPALCDPEEIITGAIPAPNPYDFFDLFLCSTHKGGPLVSYRARPATFPYPIRGVVGRSFPARVQRGPSEAARCASTGA